MRIGEYPIAGLAILIGLICAAAGPDGVRLAAQ